MTRAQFKVAVIFFIIIWLSIIGLLQLTAIK